MSEDKEFENYAKKHHRIDSMYYHDYAKALTPYIIEERQMNVAQMDVFSRLMTDRNIFLGTGTVYSTHLTLPTSYSLQTSVLPVT